MMKIAFVFPPQWTPHGDGSLQIWNHEVTRRVAKSSDVIVYARTYSSAWTETVEGVLYQRVPARWDSRLLKYAQLVYNLFGNRRPLYSTDLWYPGYALRVALDLRKRGCDVVHVYNYPQIANVIKRLNPAARVILNLHGNMLTEVKFNNLSSRLRNMDSVVSCSDLVAEPVRAGFPEIAIRCHTVPMGVSVKEFSRNYQNARPVGAHPRRLLFVGRISPEKYLHVLLEAFEKVVSQYPDASLTIVGPEWIASRAELADLYLEKAVADRLEPFYKGSYLQQLKDRLSPETSKRVTFTGLVAHADIPMYYANADIYISPSPTESFGMSIIEAMIAGLPVVASEGGAVPELVSDRRTGMLVAAGDPQAMADGIMALFSDQELRKSISDAARQMVQNRFSWETVAASLLDIYGTRTDASAPLTEVRTPFKECSVSPELDTPRN